MRRRWSLLRASEASMLKRSVTRVETLLTFWPPGPPLRETVKSTSCSGISRPSITLINRLSLSPFLLPEIHVVGQAIHVSGRIVWKVQSQLLSDDVYCAHQSSGEVAFA